MHDGQCISKEELADLRAFVTKNGRTWKSKLRAAWTRGEGILREVRNRVGPTGLDHLKIRPTT